jgi:PAS domain S-box-containing protein
MKVLIVEDNANDRQLLKMNIEHHGCEVMEAHDGEEALALLNQEQPVLIISDALMPRMDGFALLRAVKKEGRFAAIPFVFYSAVYTGAEDQELALSLGADAFVTKPLEPEEFWQRLQQVLSHCQLRGHALPRMSAPEEEEFYRRYSAVVASKLDEKVRELEAELARGRALQTEREQIIRELAHSRDEWERTFNTMPEVITILDKDYRILRCNRATCQLLGATEEEIVGQICHQRLWGESEPCPFCPARQTLNDSCTHQEEFSHAFHHRTFLISTTPLFDENGALESMIHIAKEITELKEIEAKYRHAQKMEAIGTLAGGIAHDFNNILSAILGYAELIQADMVEADRSTADIAQVIQAGKRAADLVRQILTFSRQTEQQRQPLRLQAIVKEVMKLLRPSLPATVAIRQDIDEACGEVLADASQVHQIVMNLCTNAYQAMRERGGVLELSLARQTVPRESSGPRQGLPAGDYVVLTVSDTGCGMDQETQARIFDPYFSTKKAIGGSGLGLAVVHGIVTACGGQIQVTSEPGQGATFTVYLPVIHGEITLGLAPASREQELPRGTERILLVDDERMIATLNQRLLETLGYRVTAVSAGTEALAIFTEQPSAFDLVLTDLSMPCMDGIELSRQLLARRPDLPIILCSGYGETPEIAAAKAMGIREFANKPILKQTLAAVVRKALDGQARGAAAGAA